MNINLSALSSASLTKIAALKGGVQGFEATLKRFGELLDSKLITYEDDLRNEIKRPAVASAKAASRKLNAAVAPTFDYQTFNKRMVSVYQRQLFKLATKINHELNIPMTEAKALTGYRH